MLVIVGPRRRPRERRALPPMGRRRSSTRPRTVTALPPTASSTSARIRPATRSAHQRPLDARSRSTPRSTRLARAARPGDRVFVVLIGHGRVGHRRRAVQPARAGPDGGGVRARCRSRFAAQHGGLRRTPRARAAASWPALSGKDRTVITATRPTASGTRRASASSSPRRSRPTRPTCDKDGRVSMLEAFTWARTPRRPTRTSATASCSPSTPCSTTTATARAPTSPGQPGGDGARRPHAVPVGRALRAVPRRRPADPELRALVGAARGARGSHRGPQGVQGQDRTRRSTRADLEQLLIDLARTNAAIQEKREAMKTRPRRRARRVAARGRWRPALGRSQQDAAGAAADRAGCRRSQFPPPQRARSRCCPARVGRRQVPPFMGLGARSRRGRPTSSPASSPYDGRFVFARLRYTQGVARRAGRRRGSAAAAAAGQGPPWSHDYPRAERNFMKILDGDHDASIPTRARSAA
ncbi:MAG: hypothetical protein MZU95_01310 [Desulfomicrobium escambiense]|nr:hypothetical protein [Desulfomicrobium escambiense]